MFFLVRIFICIDIYFVILSGLLMLLIYICLFGVKNNRRKNIITVAGKRQHFIKILGWDSTGLAAGINQIEI